MNARNQIINMLLNVNDQYEVLVAQLQAQVAELKKKYEPVEPAPATAAPAAQ